MRVLSLPPHLQAATLRRADLALLQGSTIDPTLLTKVSVSQTGRCEHGRANPISHLSGDHMNNERCSTPIHQHLRQVRELVLKSKELKSRPYTLPGQYNNSTSVRADVGEANLHL